MEVGGGGGGEETALKGAPHTPKYLETFTIGLIFWDN